MGHQVLPVIASLMTQIHSLYFRALNVSRALSGGSHGKRKAKLTELINDAETGATLTSTCVTSAFTTKPSPSTHYLTNFSSDSCICARAGYRLAILSPAFTHETEHVGTGTTSAERRKTVRAALLLTRTSTKAPYANSIQRTRKASGSSGAN